MKKLYKFFGTVLSATTIFTLIAMILSITGIRIFFQDPCKGLAFSAGGQELTPDQPAQYMQYVHLTAIFAQVVIYLILCIAIVSFLYIILGVARFLIAHFSSQKKTKGNLIKLTILCGCAGLIVSIFLFIALYMAIYYFMPLCV